MRIFLLFVLTSLTWPQSNSEPDTADVRCGGFCLLVGLESMGVSLTYDQLERKLGNPPPAGYSLDQLQKEAADRGLKTLTVETSLENLIARKESFVCLTVIEPGHFVLLADMDDKNVTIVDPPRTYQVARDAFVPIWSKKALLISRAELSSEEWTKHRIGVRSAIIWLACLLVFGSLVFGLGRLRLVRRSQASTLALCMLSALTCLGCHGSTDETPPSRPGSDVRDEHELIIEPSRVDLGRIFRKDLESHATARAKVVNRGHKPIFIQQVDVSCDCTDVILKRGSIAPGESRDLEATIKLSDSTERRTTRIVLRSGPEDSVPPLGVFTIDWQTVSPLSAEIVMVDLSPVRPNESKSETVPLWIENLELCDQCRLIATSSTSSVNCSVSPLEIPHGQHHDSDLLDHRKRLVARLKIVNKPAPDEIYYKDLVRIDHQCRDSIRARYILPVSWTVTPIVSVAPSRLSLGITQPDSQVEVTLLVRSSDGEKFRIDKVSSEEPISVEDAVFATESESLHSLNLVVVSPSMLGPWRTRIQVDTTHPLVKRLEIPISGIVSDTHR